VNTLFLEHLVRANLPVLSSITANGECQFHQQQTENVTDEQGFPAPVIERRTSEFMPCVWEVQGNTERNAHEQVIGAQTTPVTRYRLTVAKTYANDPVTVTQSDVVFLRRQIGSDEVLRLEITGVINVSNMHWLINATESKPDANYA